VSNDPRESNAEVASLGESGAGIGLLFSKFWHARALGAGDRLLYDNRFQAAVPETSDVLWPQFCPNLKLF